MDAAIAECRRRTLAHIVLRENERFTMEFVNGQPDEIVFGLNMTTLTFHLARALGREWSAGDEVIVTELDHHGNVAPWQALARERGIVLRTIPLRVEDGTGARLGLNHPMGPLELSDFIGNDVMLSVLDVLHRGFGDPKFRAAPLLRQMVSAGHLGRKTGRGFYRYDERGTKIG